jgi:hypothetical protein
LLAADAVFADEFRHRKADLMRYGTFVFAAVLSVAPVTAYADVTIASETAGAGGAPSARVIYVTAGEVKVDSPKTAVIFEIGAGKMVNILKEKKQYMEIDVNALGARVNDVAELMKQKLKSVPEAQRKMIEAMVAQHVGGASGGPKIQMSYQKSGDSKTIGAWPCQVFHQKKDGKLFADLCIAKADAVGLTAEDIAAIRALATAVTRSLPAIVKNNAAMMDFDEQTRQIGFSGIPVEAVLYRDGAAFSTTTVKTIDHAAIAPETFAIPAGYAKKAMPGLAGGL